MNGGMFKMDPTDINHELFRFAEDVEFTAAEEAILLWLMVELKKVEYRLDIALSKDAFDYDETEIPEDSLNEMSTRIDTLNEVMEKIRELARSR